MDLPKSTVVNRFVAKEKFYSKTDISNRLRQQFIDQIQKITWANKIAPETLNISAGEYAELQVFEVELKTKEFSERVLKQIDTHIPYPILFILRFGEQRKAVMAYKQPYKNDQHKMKTEAYYGADWQTDLTLELKSNSVDGIYKNYLSQLNPRLDFAKQSTAQDAVAQDKNYQKLQKEIDAINKKIKREVSTSKKHDLVHLRRELQKKMDEISTGGK